MSFEGYPSEVVIWVHRVIIWSPGHENDILVT